MLFRSLKRVSGSSDTTTAGAPGEGEQNQQRSPRSSLHTSPKPPSHSSKISRHPFSRISSGPSSSKNLSNGFLIQKYEPGIRFPIKTFNGKIFLCSKEKDYQNKSTGVHKLHYLGITQHQLIELTPLPMTPPPPPPPPAAAGGGEGTAEAAAAGDGSPSGGGGREEVVLVQECHELNGLKKVKFKRGEIISFEFHSGILKRYFMFDSAECVSYVKQQMTNSGIQSTQISTGAAAAGGASGGGGPWSSCRGGLLQPMTTQSLLSYVKDLEYQFSLHPSHELVIQMVDLLREAAECFGGADDERYQTTLISYVQSFLQREDVIQILDQQSPSRPSRPPPSITLPLPSQRQQQQNSEEQGQQKKQEMLLDEEASSLPPVGQIPQSQMTSDSPASGDGGGEVSRGEEDPQILTSSPHNGIHGHSLGSFSPVPPTDQGDEESLTAPGLDLPFSSEDLLPLLSLFSEEAGGKEEDDFSQSDSDDDDNSYLHLQPLHHPSSSASSLSLALLWGEEGLQLFNETLLRIDQGESELGSILSDLDLELQEILGSPADRKQQGDGREGGEVAGGGELVPENDFIVTFEEFDNFLEELLEERRESGAGQDCS